MQPASINLSLKDRPMVLFQFLVVLFCVVANIADGFDSLSIAFAAPAISREWRIEPRMLGVVLSAASFGLVLGSLTLPPLADRFGRKIVIVAATAIVTLAMLGAAMADSIIHLVIARFLTGIAIGALIPSLNIVVSEYANEKLGNVFLSILHVGFAIGAISCSIVSAFIIEAYGWRSLFLTAALIGAAICLIAAFLLPESLDYLVSRQPKNALARINRLLPRLGMAPLVALPPKPEIDPQRQAGRALFLTPLLLAPTLFLWMAALSHYFVSYFQTNWTPKILVDAGLSDTAAISSGVVMGLAAATGNILMGSFAKSFGVYRLTMMAFCGGAISLCAFGFLDAHPVSLLAAAGCCSFFIQATFTGTMIASTRFFPAAIRGTGVGIVVGLGRIGGIAGPLVAGVLISSGWGRIHYFPIFAAVCLIGVAGMFLLGRLLRRREAFVAAE